MTSCYSGKNDISHAEPKGSIPSDILRKANDKMSNIYQDNRKISYKHAFFKGDYFVIKHISNFVHGQIKSIRNCGDKQSHLADIGCGEQPLRLTVQERGFKYTGIDITQNSTASVDIIAALPVISMPDETYDYILCTEVLEHVYEYKQAIHEMARLLKKGGKLIITVPFIYPLHEEPFDFQRISMHAFVKAGLDSGLTVDHLEKKGNEPEVIATIWDNMWSRSVKRNFGGKLFIVVMRLIGNISAIILSFLFHRILTQKCYLTTTVVFSKN